MEAKPETQPKPEPPKPAQSPVMDVVAPPAQPAEEKLHSPSNDEAVPQTDAEKKPEPKSEKLVLPPKPQKPVLPKQPHSGVGLAIVATVIIVLGLAAMAVYAYLKTK